MIVQLLPDQIPDAWEYIKYGAVQVQRPVNVTLFCRNLLKNLMAGKYQAWIITDDEKKVKGVLITRIFVDIGDIPSLLVDTIYGYSMTTLQEKKEAFETMVKFAKEIGCANVAGMVADPAVARVGAQAVGMKPAFTVYSMAI